MVKVYIIIIMEIHMMDNGIMINAKEKGFFILVTEIEKWEIILQVMKLENMSHFLMMEMSLLKFINKYI